MVNELNKEWNLLMNCSEKEFEFVVSDFFHKIVKKESETEFSKN